MKASLSEQMQQFKVLSTPMLRSWARRVVGGRGRVVLFPAGNLICCRGKLNCHMLICFCRHRDGGKEFTAEVLLAFGTVRHRPILSGFALILNEYPNSTSPSCRSASGLLFNAILAQTNPTPILLVTNLNLFRAEKSSLLIVTAKMEMMKR